MQGYGSAARRVPSVFVHKIDRHTDNDVQAAVTVAFRLLDIIFDLHDMYVILRHQAVTDQIYILDIGTDYAHSGDIVNIVARCAECQIKILF